MPPQCLDYPIEKTVNLLRATHVKPPFNIDTKISCECKDGYILGNHANPPVFTCQLLNNIAVWQIDFSCIPVSCGDPGYVDYADRSGNLFVFPEKVKFTCHDGYKMEGSKKNFKFRYCGTNRLWTPALEIIKCEFVGITCPPPGPFPNITILPMQDSYSVRNVIMFHCLITNKTQSSICKNNGYWSDLPPPCEPKEIVSKPPAEKHPTFSNNGPITPNKQTSTTQKQHLTPTKPPIQAKKIDYPKTMTYLMYSIIFLFITLVIIFKMS